MIEELEKNQESSPHIITLQECLLSKEKLKNIKIPNYRVVTETAPEEKVTKKANAFSQEVASY